MSALETGTRTGQSCQSSSEQHIAGVYIVHPGVPGNEQGPGQPRPASAYVYKRLTGQLLPVLFFQACTGFAGQQSQPHTMNARMHMGSANGCLIAARSPDARLSATSLPPTVMPSHPQGKEDNVHAPGDPDQDGKTSWQPHEAG